MRRILRYIFWAIWILSVEIHVKYVQNAQKNWGGGIKLSQITIFRLIYENKLGSINI